MFVYCSGDDEATRFEKEKRDLKRSGETASKQAELNALLATPLIQSGFSGKYPTMTGKLELPKSLAGSQVYSFKSANPFQSKRYVPIPKPS